MFEFLGALQKQLTAVCKGFTEWLEQLTPDATITASASVQSSYSDQVNELMKMVLLAVQRVMNRHKDDCYTLNTSEGGEAKVNDIRCHLEDGTSAFVRSLAYKYILVTTNVRMVYAFYTLPI